MHCFACGVRSSVATLASDGPLRTTARDELRPLVQAIEIELERPRGVPAWQWLLVFMCASSPPNVMQYRACFRMRAIHLVASTMLTTGGLRRPLRRYMHYPPVSLDSAQCAREVAALKAPHAYVNTAADGSSNNSPSRKPAVRALRRALVMYHPGESSSHWYRNNAAGSMLIDVQTWHCGLLLSARFVSRMAAAPADKNRAEEYGMRWAVLCEEVAKIATTLIATEMRGGEDLVCHDVPAAP